MKFEQTCRVEQQGEVIDALYRDLEKNMGKLPLERFCTRGGWPLKEKISNIVLLENSSARLVVMLYVSFTETGAACCSGDNFEYEHFEELKMVINKQGWRSQFPKDDRPVFQR